MDDSFEDVSRIGKYSDIMATTDNEIKILIELKDYKNQVPSLEIEKFWRDMEIRNTKYGIFISMRSDISKCSSCINLKRNMNRTAIFVVNSDLDWKGHLFAFYVIKKLAEIESIKRKKITSKDIEGVINKIHTTIIDIQKLTEDLEEINKIADDIRNLNINRLNKITSIVNVYKQKLGEKIQLALTEFKRVEI